MPNKLKLLYSGATLISLSSAAMPVLSSPATAATSASTPAQLASSFVLTSHQIGPGFESKAESYTPTQLAAQGTWTLAQLRSWGYEAGFERVFDKDLNSPSAVQIASNAGVYRTVSGAAASLEANGNACTVGSWQVLRAPAGLGNAAVFCTKLGHEAGATGRLYFLLWRIGPFKGSITLSGLIGHVKETQIIALARTESARMTALEAPRTGGL